MSSPRTLRRHRGERRQRLGLPVSRGGRPPSLAPAPASLARRERREMARRRQLGLSARGTPPRRALLAAHAALRPAMVDVVALVRAERRRNAECFEVRHSAIQGRGLFARCDLSAGETLLYIGELASAPPAGGRYTAVHGGIEGVFVVPPASCRPYAAYANHEKIGGALEFVWGGEFPLLRLRRAVRAGEELCVDYGPLGDEL